MISKYVVAMLTVVAALLIISPATVLADSVISEPGEGAGQANNPLGLAVNTETGTLYVADSRNNRINVFDAEGQFVKAFGWGVQSNKESFQTCTTTCRKGIAGDGAGQLNKPFDVEVDNACARHEPPLTPLTTPTCAEFDPANGNLYVTDLENHRVQEFTESGDFILTYGGGVDKSVPGDICTAASGHTCGAGTVGSEEGEFMPSTEGMYISIGPTGTAYVVDDRRISENSFIYEVRLQRFDPSGASASSAFALPQGGEGPAVGIAVDSTGDFWVDTGGILRKFDSSTTMPPLVEIDGGTAFGSVAIGNLAIDSEDNVFVGDREGGPNKNVIELSPAGVPLRRFGYGSLKESPAGLAPFQSASGDIYVSETDSSDGRGRVLHLGFPAPGPLPLLQPCVANPVGNLKGTLLAKINPEGNPSTYHFEYIQESVYQKDVSELGVGHGFDHALRAPAQASDDPTLPGDFELHQADVEASLSPSTDYRCRVRATNADGTTTGLDGTFKSKPPFQIVSTWTSSVGLENVTLDTTVNPLGIPTTGYFEYVDDATYNRDVAELGAGNGFAHAKKAPEFDEIDFGGGEDPRVGTADVVGLSPGTTYHYRVVAIDPFFPAGLPGPAKLFRTHLAHEGGLEDDRSYELVSPAQKGSAEVAIPGRAGGLYQEERIVRTQAASGSDQEPAITYTSWTSFGEANGAPSASQYLSKRTTTGWATQNISPIGRSRNVLEPPFRGFAPDLSTTAFVADTPLLTDDAQAGVQNLYLRDNQTGALRALTNEPPQFVPDNNQIDFGSFCSAYAGASADGDRAFFSANGAMAGAPTGIGLSLYEWSSAEGLRLVSVLPSGKPAAPARTSGFGAGNGFCSMDQHVVDHAVSEDGSIAFWTYGGKSSGSESPLFARINGVETVQLDAKAGGVGPAGKGAFWAASANGSKVLFTAPGKLTADAGGEGQLYRYDMEERSLADLTPGATAPGIQGVVGMSENGAYAYFVATGVLTGEEENDSGEKAIKGAKNLYVFHEGEGLRFIGILSELDEGVWSSAPSTRSARLTPDGRSLAFLSVEAGALSGYDNTIFPGDACQPTFSNELGGDPHCAEAFLYEAEDENLICASCNPSGARPTGPAALPAWSNPFAGPRYLSADGSRLFFESRDALSAADENSRRDVYEFERVGKGTCEHQSPGFDEEKGGCISLISDGHSTDESYLLDASLSGKDVFISTRSPLMNRDEDENYDVYDAREAGGFSEPSKAAPCRGEAACKPPASLPPVAPSPVTPTFRGPGNVVEKPHKKRHRAKKHRKRHKKTHRKNRQTPNGRSAR